MEKKATVSIWQIILILFITRLLFSTSYQSAINAGNSIQDVLPSILVNFVTNIIIAIPILALLNKYPGHDLVECTIKVLGRGAGNAVAFLYFLFFLANAIFFSGNFDNFFTTDVIPNVNTSAVLIFLLIVSVYGAIKGVEAIARVSSVTAFLYVIGFAVIILTLIPSINLGFLKPFFYSGPKYFADFTVMNYNLSIQIVLFAFLVPFHREGSIKKTYFLWNLISTLFLLIVEFISITVLGAYGAKVLYPLELLAKLSSISIFTRLDAIHLIPWILNAVITVTISIYLAVSCLLKVGLNNHRKLIAIVSGIIVLIVAPFISENFNMVQLAICSLPMTAIITIFIAVMPGLILIIDMIKERVLQNEKSA